MFGSKILWPLAYLCTTILYAEPVQNNPLSYEKRLSALKEHALEALRDSSGSPLIVHYLDQARELEKEIFAGLSPEEVEASARAKIYLKLLYLQANLLTAQGSSSPSENEILAAKILKLRQHFKIRGPHEWPSSWKDRQPKIKLKWESFTAGNQRINRWVNVRESGQETLLESSEPYASLLKASIQRTHSYPNPLPPPGHMNSSEPLDPLAVKKHSGASLLQSPWFWTGLAVVVGGGTGFFIYESSRNRRAVTP